MLWVIPKPFLFKTFVYIDVIGNPKDTSRTDTVPLK